MIRALLAHALLLAARRLEREAEDVERIHTGRWYEPNMVGARWLGWAASARRAATDIRLNAIRVMLGGRR